MSHRFFLKKPNFRHLDRLTTSLGLMQHAQLEIPDPKHGYSIDDNARALIIMLKYWQLHQDPESFSYIDNYLRYLERAKTTKGFFHNFADFSGKFTDQKGSTDSFGRTFWALAYTVSVGLEPFASRAEKLVKKVEKNISSLEFLRSKTFVLLGYYFLKNKKEVERLADDLLKDFKQNHKIDWRWFEDKMTYSNAALPQALFFAYDLTKKKKYLRAAKLSFDFLNKVSHVQGKPAPIGQAGWFKKGKDRAIYDQQAVDAGKMVSTSLLAYEVTKEKKYLDIAEEWFRWFHKNNIAGVELVDPYWGGCYDGITPNGVNHNKGAESTIAYLMAYLDFGKIAYKTKEGK